MTRALRHLALWGVWAAAAGALGAQEVPAQASGRLDSTAVWTSDAPDTAVGLVTGWVGLTSGTKAVKTELRLGLTNLPAPGVTLNRAWIKFRQPGWRVTTGLGRIGWGPGFVFVPGDLLFDSTSSPADWTADDLRSAPAWLGDLWVALGDEAFAEAAVRPTAAALRVSAAPGGVTLEASGLWDQGLGQASGALSAQAALGGLDWYATLRGDGLEAPASARAQASAGVFGLWSPAESWSVATRHEALAGSSSPSSTWRTYHDLALTYETWTLTGRVLTEGAWSKAAPSADLAWALTQGLTLRAGAAWSDPLAASIGATARW